MPASLALEATVVPAKEVDKQGMDCNEATWTIGWAMEYLRKIQGLNDEHAAYLFKMRILRPSNIEKGGKIWNVKR